jgi:hypothetical protein
MYTFFEKRHKYTKKLKRMYYILCIIGDVKRVWCKGSGVRGIILMAPLLGEAGGGFILAVGRGRRASGKVV